MFSHVYSRSAEPFAFHVLHSTPFLLGGSPNTVRRTVERGESGIYIRIRGVGTGPFPSVNEGLAPHFCGIPSSLTSHRFNRLPGRNWNPIRFSLPGSGKGGLFDAILWNSGAVENSGAAQRVGGARHFGTIGSVEHFPALGFYIRSS